MGSAWEATKSMGKMVGTGLVDVATLGQSYQARKMAEQQQAMLDNMKNQQNQQIEQLKKIGPTPTQEMPTQDQSEKAREKRLRNLRAGLASTIKSSSSGVMSSAKISTAKAKLGE